ncbi:hypothetical protein FACS1894219_10270 [Clostridia bacterium]|nr:hypothetical protein FACS1894219_10270 [Clostridia bacterium]
MAKRSDYPIRVDNSAQPAYEGAFNAKIDAFADHTEYPKFRAGADSALNLHTGFGLDAITANDYMNRIIVQPTEEIEKWLNGKSGLEWSQAEIDYGTDKLAMEAASRFAVAQHDKTENGGSTIMDENSTLQGNPNSSPPLVQNEYVQELFSILQENNKDTKGLAALIGHVSEMESFVKRAEDKIADMKSQLSEMKEVQNHPVKTALQNAIKSLETKVAEVKERIAELKTNIIEGCKSAVESFKEKGAAALNNLAEFFHIKGGLKAIDKGAEQTVKQCDKAIAAISEFGQNYHAAGRAVKNMGLIIIGKEPVDAKKENGIIVKVAAAPYKAEKAIQNGIKKAVTKAIAALEGMEERQAERQTERADKPDMLAKINKNKERVEREKLEMPTPERTKTAGLDV